MALSIHRMSHAPGPSAQTAAVAGNLSTRIAAAALIARIDGLSKIYTATSDAYAHNLAESAFSLDPLCSGHLTRARYRSG